MTEAEFTMEDSLKVFNYCASKGYLVRTSEDKVVLGPNGEAFAEECYRKLYENVAKEKGVPLVDLPKEHYMMWRLLFSLEFPPQIMIGSEIKEQYLKNPEAFAVLN